MRATADQNDLHAIAATWLRADAQRYTAGRRALVDLLATADHPLTTAELLDRDPTLAQSSVYRNLAVLERSGVVSRVVAHDEYARFELAEALSGHHHHLICTVCGSVTDVTLPPKVERALDQALHTAAHDVSFTVEEHRLDLMGRCARCS